MGSSFTPVSIEKAFRDARNIFLQSGIDSADLDAALLLELACGATTLLRVTDPEKQMSAQEAERFAGYISRRLAREPAHRIIGNREFYGLSLKLNEATLIPRPDTEILVDTVLPFATRRVADFGECTILDLGTGTGAIALALLHEVPQATALGIDVSVRSLEAASENAVALGLDDRFATQASNWFKNVVGKFDLVVSNPPYIPTSVLADLDADVRDHDPTLALDGGSDGLNAYGAIAANALSFLKKGGRIAVEIGFDQKASVTSLFTAAGFTLVEARNDLNGQNRVLFFA